MTGYLKSTLLPVLLGAALTTMVMRIYCGIGDIPVAVISLAVESVLFLFFRLLQRQGKKGGVYFTAFTLALALFLAYTLSSSFTDAPSKFDEWFYGVQSEATFYFPFVFFLFAAMSFFFASVLYYFTQILYRSPFVLLCVFVPFAVYVKRYQTPDVLYIAIIIALFLAVMVHQRQLTDGTETRTDLPYITAVGLFVCAALAAAIAIPKIEFTPLREQFEQFVNSVEVGTVRSQLSGRFREESEGSGFGDNSTGETIFYVSAKEPLYLKSQTYELYSGDRKWEITEEYSRTGYKHWVTNASLLDRNSLKAIPELSDINTSDNALSAYIIHESYPTTFFSSVNGVYSISRTIKGESITTYRTPSGYIFGDEHMQIDPYAIGYYSEKCDIEAGAAETAAEFTAGKWEELLNRYSEDDSVLVRVTAKEYLLDLRDAYGYYSDTFQEPSEELRALAEELTGSLDSDYEKAEAIRDYFLDGSFYYDLDYTNNDRSIESFIFRQKRGICVDYATAMTLLARAAGLPARYCEGFLVSEENAVTREDFTDVDIDESTEDAPIGGYTLYSVHDDDAHAFCEVFVAGYGWMTFDATPSADMVRRNQQTANMPVIAAETFNAIGVSVIVAIVFAALVLLLIRPVTALMFSLLVRFSSGNNAALLIIKRIRKVADLIPGINPSSLTVNELREEIYRFSGRDILPASSLAEKLFYAGEKAGRDEVRAAKKCLSGLRRDIKKARKLSDCKKRI